MKYKITLRLIGYFSAVLLLFSIIVGGLFGVVFKRHTTQVHEKELENRAVSIADTLSQFMKRRPKSHGMGGHGMGGLTTYLQFIDDIAMSEVWLVDEKAQTIQVGHMGSALSYEELPDGAEKLIKRVFRGNVETNQGFSSLLGVPSVTAGAPVRDSDGTVIAALLLHSPIEGIDQAQQDGMVILALCILAALLLVTALSILLARRFIRPLKRMGMATERIMRGDYSVNTGVTQDDEIGSLARNIDQLSLKLSEVENERKNLDKMRQDFVSNISHELRTPVTVIKGSLEVLNQGLITDPEEIREYFHQMLGDTVHLERLVNDLLELSRLQNTNFNIEKTDLNLTDVVTEVARSMVRVAEKKEVDLVFINEAGSFLFFGDYGRLRQMLTIVTDNAIKFSPSGERVTVLMKKRDKGCVVSVSDHGKGILKEDIPYIFERFYRERSEENKTGSGLGLSIAKQIASRHEIEIKCTSQKDQGTCFSFYFKELQNPKHSPQG